MAFSVELLTAVGGIVAALAALAGVGLKVFNVWRKWNQEAAMRGMERAVEAMDLIYSALLRAQNHTSVQRSMVIEAHNGGGIPDSDTELKISVRIETPCYEIVPAKAMVQDHAVDLSYNAVLRKIMAERWVVFDVETMPDSWLKDFYRAHSIRSAYIRLAGFSASGMYYVAAQSVNAVAEADDLSAIKTHLSLAADRVVQCYRLSVYRDKRQRRWWQPW